MLDYNNNIIKTRAKAFIHSLKWEKHMILCLFSIIGFRPLCSLKPNYALLIQNFNFNSIVIDSRKPELSFDILEAHIYVFL